MPHKCVRCGKVYPNNSSQLLKGCQCGTRIFIYLQNEDVSISEALESGLEAVVSSGRVQELAKSQPVSIEMVSGGGKASGKSAAGDTAEMAEYLGAQSGASGQFREQPAENITVLDRGEYELDLASIMRGDPLVVRSQNGIYYLKIPSVRRKD
jgi:predicted  nucleic acid-binding Zn-ribbon protein